MSNSKFIVIAAPSGSGKTTIVNKLLKEKNLNLSFSVSATSRAPRNNEVDGLNYFFLSKDEFIKRIDNTEFIEWEEVYENIRKMRADKTAPVDTLGCDECYAKCATDKERRFQVQL